MELIISNKIVLIDDKDFELVSKYKWYINERGYVRACNVVPVVRMHRLIMGANVGQDIDHINRNKLDNRKCNLRFASPRENSKNTSSYKGGVTRIKNGKYTARIYSNNKSIFLGNFDTKEEALEVRRKYELNLEV